MTAGRRGPRYPRPVQVDVFTSGIWQTTTTLVGRGDACLVIDPAYFPREVAAIADAVAARGQAAAVVFTHGHWDHVMGHAALPAAPVWMSAVLDAAIAAGAPRATGDLEDARAFDARWYVPRPAGHAWPTRRRGLADGVAEVIPGHGPRLTAAAATTIAQADLAYVEQLLDAGARGDRAAAAAIALPRAADVVGMLDHHRANCAKLGL